MPTPRFILLMVMFGIVERVPKPNDLTDKDVAACEVTSFRDFDDEETIKKYPNPTEFREEKFTGPETIHGRPVVSTLKELFETAIFLRYNPTSALLCHV